MVVASRWSLRRDEKERPAGVLETNNDITERKHREEEIRSLNQELLKRSTELEATNKELEALPTPCRMTYVRHFDILSATQRCFIKTPLLY